MQWIIVDMLRAILPHVEHYYHTHEDPSGMWWQLIEAMRRIFDAYPNNS